MHYDSNNSYGRLALCENPTTTVAQAIFEPPVEMRTVPTMVTSGAVTHYSLYNKATITATTNMAISTATSSKVICVGCTIGSANLLLGGASQLMTNNNTSYYIAFDAEL